MFSDCLRIHFKFLILGLNIAVLGVGRERYGDDLLRRNYNSFEYWNVRSPAGSLRINSP
jgi:hypothetical protein